MVELLCYTDFWLSLAEEEPSGLGDLRIRLQNLLRMYNDAVAKIGSIRRREADAQTSIPSHMITRV
jgi:hypothetical protein